MSTLPQETTLAQTIMAPPGVDEGLPGNRRFLPALGRPHPWAIPIDDAPPGLYTIWIGSVSPGAGQAGNLYISGCPEFDPSKPDDNPCWIDDAGG